MTPAELAELVAACETAIDTAHRSLAMARALTEGCRSGLRPPEDVVDAYLVRVERDELQIKALREKVARLRGRPAPVSAGS